MNNQKEKFSIGLKIRSVRLSQNLTQGELASRVTITANYLSLLETNQREATIDVYRCIAKALNIPVWQLFCDLSDELLLVLELFEDCSAVEIRALTCFINGNKYALRQYHNQEFGLRIADDSYGQLESR